jgi:excisionase family DNA binding protein
MTTIIRPDDIPEVAPMSVSAAAALTGISPAAFYRAIHKGELPSVRVGRRLLVPIAKLYELLGLEINPNN